MRTKRTTGNDGARRNEGLDTFKVGAKRHDHRQPTISSETRPAHLQSRFLGLAAPDIGGIGTHGRTSRRLACAPGKSGKMQRNSFFAGAELDDMVRTLRGWWWQLRSCGQEFKVV